MRNLLAFFAAALLTFAGLGWYLDWYTVSSTAVSEGHRQLNINLNTAKIGEDIEKGGEKVREILEKSDKKQPPGNAQPKANDPPKSPKPSPSDSKSKT
jgi:hypothetical protein